MSIAPNMELVSEVLPVHRRDFDLGVPDLLNPLNANPLVDGEWLELNASYQMIRGAGAAAVPSYPVFAERGRYDTQAIGKVPFLYFGMYEAETRVVTAAGLAVGDFLTVADVTLDGLTRRGLVKAAGIGEHLIVGTVTRLPSNGRVRFIHTGPFQISLAA